MKPRQKLFHLSLVLLLALMSISLVAAPLPASAAVAPAVSPAIDADTGFPAWYGDANGTRLQLCIDAADPCLAGTTVPDPTQPPSIPSNFPEEAFFYAADATITTLPGGNKLVAIFHLEAAFGGATGGPVKGEQITFGRMQFKVTGGLVPGAQYTITHPYGSNTYTAGADGTLLPTKTPTREEVGCGATPPACDFSQALGSKIAQNFLLPAAGVAVPAGFIGDGVTEVAVTGSPAGNNFVSIVGPGVNASTTLFTLAGKLAGPLISTPKELNFGNQEVYTTSTAKTITLNNAGTASLTINSATAGGADYVVTNGSRPCIGVTLPADGECDLSVTYSPALIGAGSDNITVASSVGAAAQKSYQVRLFGTGIAANTAPVASFNKTSVDFGEARVGTLSDVQTVTLKNNGNAPWNVFTAKLSGAAAGDFALTGNTCTAIAPGGSCAIDLQFAPQRTPGTRSASLDIVSDAPGSPHSIALKGLAHAGLAQAALSTDPNTGFPDWYQDSTGRRLTLCDNFGDLNCLPDTTAPNPGNPAVPSNFAEEAFYWAGDSTVDIASGNKAVLTMATEAAFGGATGLPAAGDQITFGRLQVRVTGGLQPNTAYKFTHPYGVDIVTTNASGAIPAATTPGARVETGCGVTPPACDFGIVLGSRVGPWLTPAPGQAAAPSGYIADPNVEVKVVGSPYNTNFFQIEGPNVGGPGVDLVKTDLFTLAGKIAGPASAEPSSLDFNSQDVGTASAAQIVMLTNLGSAPMTVSGISSNNPEFAQTGSTCGVALGQDQSCTVSITFTPTAQGIRQATLTVNDNVSGTPLAIQVAGTGLTPATAPTASPDTSGLSFDGQRVGTTGAAQTVTLKNTGDADLNLASVAITGANAGDFVKGSSNCPPILTSGAVCTTDVKFKPTATGTRSAALTYTDNSGNVGGATQSVALSGTGTQAVAEVKPSSLSFSKTLVAGNATPQAVTVTNKGTASLTISDVAIAGTNANQFGVTSNDCTGSGVTLQPGQSCTVNVGFSPTTAGTKTASLVFTDNGATTSQTAALTGVGGDPVAPTVSAPVQKFTEAGMPLKLTIASPIANSKIPIAIRWSQTNADPLDHYELQMATGTSATPTWANVPLADKTATSARVDLTMGTLTAAQTYQFRVRGYGTATGVMGSWATGPRFTLFPWDDTNTSSIGYSGSWNTTLVPAGAYNNSIHWSVKPGANASLNKLTFTVTGNVAFVSTMGPDRGQYQVTLDGVKQPVMDLYAPTQQAALVPYAADNISASVQHTVVVTILGTANAKSTGSRVDIDAFVIIR